MIRMGKKPPAGGKAVKAPKPEWTPVLEEKADKGISNADDTLAYALELVSAFTSGNFNVAIDMERDKAGTGLIKALADMQSGLAQSLGDLKASTELVHRSSLEMNATVKALRDHSATVEGQAAKVADSTSEMSTNLTTVSAASEELSVSMKAIADSAKQSDENIDVIATGTRDLTTASQEIARSTVRATEISRKALDNVIQATKLVTDLEAAAKEIGVVTSTISEISDQTKLLALNATIEAARAGEAGRGFAVVAKEVKDLASQTNTATRDIQGKIEIIQGVTNRTISAIEMISAVMREVDGVITTIAAATEEQSSTTKNIAANVGDTTERIKEMSSSVKEGALAVQDVNKSISGITNISGEVSKAVNSVRDSSSAIKIDTGVSYAHVLGVASLGEDLRDSLSRIVLPPGFADKSAMSDALLCRFVPKYSVSVASMDSDHEKIFDFINRVHLGIKGKAPQQKIASITQDLALFTKEHFDREERMLTSGGYPGLPLQQSTHRNLLDKIGSYLQDMKDGKPVDYIEVMIFLKSWLQNHILGMDKEYGPHMNARGVR